MRAEDGHPANETYILFKHHNIVLILSENCFLSIKNILSQTEETTKICAKTLKLKVEVMLKAEVRHFTKNNKMVTSQKKRESAFLLKSNTALRNLARNNYLRCLHVL